MRKLLAGLLAASVALAALASTAAAAPAAARAAAPFDRAFIDAMVPHHAAAIAMAKAARRAGLSKPALVKIADAVVATQGREIAQMRAWRKAWYGSARVARDGGRQLGMSSADMGMDGGAGKLARAGNVDAAFAAMMVEHHRGAIRMARQALRRAQHPQLRRLARAIVQAQQLEVAIMKPFAGSGSGKMAGMGSGGMAGMNHG